MTAGPDKYESFERVTFYIPSNFNSFQLFKSKCMGIYVKMYLKNERWI